MEERRRLAPAKVWGTTLAILLTGAAGVARAQAADAPPPAAPAAPPAAPAVPPPPPTVVIVPPPAAAACRRRQAAHLDGGDARHPSRRAPADRRRRLGCASAASSRADRPEQGQRLAHGQRLRGAPRRRQDHQEGRRHPEPERQHDGASSSPASTPPTDGSPPVGQLRAVEDAIISFDFIDEFHLWAGHLLVPVDRSNASGPFFMIPWNYPGFFVGASSSARQRRGRPGATTARSSGATSRAASSRYFVGVFDNANVGSSPLFSGRLRLALLDAEPGFWGNGSYFGDKDILSIDVGGQVQGTQGRPGRRARPTPTSTSTRCSKRRSPAAAAFTAEGAYYHYNVADGGGERLALRAGGVRHPDGRRRQHPADGSLPVGEGEGQHGHEPLEPGRRVVLPDQGPGAPGHRHLQPHEALRRDADGIRPTPTPFSSARRRSSSRSTCSKIGDRQRFIASKTNT